MITITPVTITQQVIIVVMLSMLYPVAATDIMQVKQIHGPASCSLAMKTSDKTCCPMTHPAVF